MLIDASYFAAGARRIQSVTLGKGTSMESYTVSHYIALYQDEFLVSALGDTAAREVADYLAAREDNHGVENLACESVCRKLCEPFADYVFFHVLRDGNDQSTVSGLVRLKSANTYVSPIGRQVAAWNRMANRMNVFAEWVDSDECPLDGVSVSDYLLEPINRFNL